MEDIEVKAKKYIGLNKFPHLFFACFMHVTQDEDIKHVRGDLYTSVNLKLPEGKKASNLIDDVLDKLEVQYFSNLGGSVLNALELSLKNAYEVYLKYIDDNEIENAEFDLSAVVCWGDIVYIGRIGKAGVFLLRKGKVINITENLVELDDFKPVSVASGMSQVGDIFVLSTPKASEVISNWKNLASMDEDQIEDYINTLGSSEGIAFLFLLLQQKITEKSQIKRDDGMDNEFDDINAVESKEEPVSQYQPQGKTKKIDYVSIIKAFLVKVRVIIVKILIVIIKILRKLLSYLKKKFSQVRKD